MIFDGRAYFGLKLEHWRVGQTAEGRAVNGLAQIAARKGLPAPPPLDRVADADPLPARVMHGWWIVDCPCNGADFVWLDRPLQWCGSCGNAQLGGRWRRVAVPENRREIEKALLARPDPATRNWFPHETVEDLRAENAAYGLGGSA